MEYLALYRKWRPKGFADFVGQPHVVRTLKNAVAGNRVAHAYLFCGPRGTGKTTAAKILAKAVNCASPNEGDPCNECPSCRRIADGISLDVQEIDGASNRGIDEVRDLREKVRFAPAEGRYRVYIIDEVHMLTGEAFNALLKTLEEPPPQVIFIFATTEPHRVPATVLSRCQRFEFKRFAHEEIRGRLNQIAAAEGIEIEEAALDLLIAQAAGGMRDAIGFLEQTAAHAGARVAEADVREVLGLVDLEVYRDLAAAVRDRNTAGALAILAEIRAAGKDPAQFARLATSLWRDLLLLAVSGETVPLQVLPAEDNDDWQDLAKAIGSNRLLEAVELFATAAAEQKRAGEGTLPLDLALVRLTAGIGRKPDLEERLSRLEERFAALAAGTPPPAAAAPPKAPAKVPPAPARSPAGSGAEPAAGRDPGDKWPLVQERLYKLKKSLHALLSEHAHPVGLDGQAFVLGFANQAIMNRAETDRALIEQILAEVFGGSVSLRCELRAMPKRQEAGPADPVSEAIRIFDGTVEEGE